MRFSTRNAYYLRASNYRVVPTFLYLDERHVLWMSERVLGLVISAMQPKIEHLLTAEKDSKKHKVHVERGEGYQYCYFLRKTTRTEVILLKKKSYALRPPTPPPAESSRKRKSATEAEAQAPAPARRRTRGRGPSLTEMVAEEDAIIAEDDDDDFIQIKEERVDLDGDGDGYAPTPAELEDERDIKDWKPDVTLSYQGFGTTSVQLVLIVEPWPPLAPSEYAPPASRLSTRSASVISARSRSRTQGGQAGTGRYSSTSLALDNPTRTPLPLVRNMRNATRSVSLAATPAPGGRASSYLGRDSSVTPGPGAGGTRRGTPLFMPRDTPFGDDEEDEDEHEAYAAALREGRWRLPSVVPRDPADRDDDDPNPLDEPEGMVALGERLVRASEIEEGVVRTHGGWEERGEGEDSAVFGREEPGD